MKNLKDMSMNEKLWTSGDLAANLGVHPVTLSRWRRQGRGPDYIKLGKAVRYAWADVQAWLEKRRIRRDAVSVDAPVHDTSGGWMSWITDWLFFMRSEQV